MVSFSPNSTIFKTSPRLNFCLCCKTTKKITKEYGVVSPFFARRAMLTDAFIAEVIKCSSCGSKFFNVNVSNNQLSRLYDGYRDNNYFQLRNSFEPWYSKRINDDIGGEKNFSKRRKVLIDALASAKIDNNFFTVLDHGGDQGQMLSGVNFKEKINANKKYVYDISGKLPSNGIKHIDHNEMLKINWDLILSCHVLEHLTDPEKYISDLARIGRNGTLYFFEVPNEVWTSFKINQTVFQFNWLNLLINFRYIFKWMHLISVIFKLKLKFIPPFLFPALSEHLNFFTVKGLGKILQKAGLRVRASYIADSGHIVAIAEKIS